VARASNQTICTLFSARELIAALPPPPAARLSAPALVRAALLRPREPRTDAPLRARWWQIALDLLREGGLLAARDAPRGRRRVAFWGALVYQAVWLIALIWFAFARFAGSPGAAEAQPGTLVEVEFIERTPVPASAEAAPRPLDSAPVPARHAPTAAPPPPPVTAPPPMLAANEPEPSPTPPDPAPPSESPLQVTAVDEPDHDFTLYAPVLPAPTVPDVPLPPVPVAEVVLREVPLLNVPASTLPQREAPVAVPAPPSAPVAEVVLREIPLLQPSPERLPPRDIELPRLSPSIPVVEAELRPVPGLLQPPSERLPPRDIELPDLSPSIPMLEAELRPVPGPLPEVTVRTIAPPELPPGVDRLAAGRTAQPIREREITLRPDPPAASDTAAASTEVPAAPAEQPRASTPTAAPSASASNTPLRDDWGQARADGGSGLLDAAGRPRLADGSAAGRLPPGTIVENYENIDRMGTWLKRPPTGYQASTFEPLWLPPENLLEEWVRRSIKTILIPIPGTGKSIQCTVAFLMLGGGCGIRDMNLLDIEATARTPPEVPFKPELHEDQSILAAPMPRPLPEHTDGQQD